MHRVVEILAGEPDARGVGVLVDHRRHRVHVVPGRGGGAFSAGLLDEIAVDVERLCGEGVRVAPAGALDGHGVEHARLVGALQILRDLGGNDQAVVGQLAQRAAAHVGDRGRIAGGGQRQRLVLAGAPGNRLHVDGDALVRGGERVDHRLVSLAHLAAAHDEVDFRAVLGQCRQRGAAEQDGRKAECLQSVHVFSPCLDLVVHSLTAPAVSPATRYFCRNRNTTITGSTPVSEAAIISFQVTSW